MSRGRTPALQDMPQNSWNNHHSPPQSQPSLEIIEPSPNLSQHANHYHSNTTSQQAQHGFQGTNPAASPGNNTYLHPSILNPYTPPVMDAKILAKVGKLDYVDFDVILPTPIQTTSEQSFGIEVTPEDSINITRNNTKSGIKFLTFLHGCVPGTYSRKQPYINIHTYNSYLIRKNSATWSDTSNLKPVTAMTRPKGKI